MSKHVAKDRMNDSYYSDVPCDENAYHGGVDIRLQKWSRAGYCPRHMPALYAMYDAKHRATTFTYE